MGNAPAFQFLFARNAERALGGACGDDHCARRQIEIATRDAETGICLCDGLDRIEREFDAGLVRLHLQHRAEFETGHAFGRSREIVDAVDIDHLAAGAEHVDDHRAGAMPGGGDGGIEPCHAGADDHDVVIVRAHRQRQSSTETVVR